MPKWTNRTRIESSSGENERVKRFGFTETELERTKKSMLSSIEKAYNERDKQKSDSYAEEYTRNFLMTEEPFPGIENEYMYYQSFIPRITLEEVNALANEWIIDHNRVIIITAPEIEGVKIPTEEDILLVLSDVENSDLVAYEDVTIDRPLIEEEIKPGSIVAERQLTEVGAVEWTLSNGAIVVFKDTDFKDDEILFTSYSLGGNSQYGQDMDISADMAATIVSMSGIGEFDNVSLEKLLSDKVFSISPYLGDLTEGFSGSSSVQDLESMLQMLYLYFTDLRVDSQAFSSYIQRLSAILENKKASPDAAFSDTLQAVSVNYHPRKRPMTTEILEEVNLDDINAIAHERYTNAADFKFFFVGNIDKDTFKSFIEKYIGSIPSTDKNEMWKDLKIEAPDGVVEKMVYQGQEARSTHYSIFHGDFEYSKENLITINAVGKILETRLLEVIREEMGSVYSIGASPSVDRLPKPEYNIVIYYGTDPEKVDEIQQAVFTQIKDIAEKGPSDEDLLKAKEKLRRERETSMRENRFWLNILNNGYLYKNGDFSDFANYNEIVDQITVEEIKVATKRYFNFDSYYSVTLKQEQ